MVIKPIEKRPAGFAVRPNLLDYDAARLKFTWSAAREALSGLPRDGGLNIAHEAVVRHALGNGSRIAIRWLGKAEQRKEISYAQLHELTNRFANVLVGLGVAKADGVFVLAGRIPELYVAVLGALKHRCVVTPLFSAFGPEPIVTRMQIGSARVLVTTAGLYGKKVGAIRDRLPLLDHVLVVPDAEDSGVPEGTRSLDALLAQASVDYEIEPTHPQDHVLLHFTSGTTGKPKGAVHVHDAVVAHHATGALALDFHPEDVFWCTADPGWVTGTSYGIIAPLSHGITMVVDEADFDVQRWYRILSEEAVSVWYTAPTAIRMMMKGGSDLEIGRAHV